MADRIIKIFVRTNHARLYLDSLAFRRGEVKLAAGSVSEQCEGCGHDLIETAQPYGPRFAVVCTECDSVYDIFERDLPLALPRFDLCDLEG